MKCYHNHNNDNIMTKLGVVKLPRVDHNNVQDTLIFRGRHRYGCKYGLNNTLLFVVAVITMIILDPYFASESTTYDTTTGKGHNHLACDTTYPNV